MTTTIARTILAVLSIVAKIACAQMAPPDSSGHLRAIGLDFSYTGELVGDAAGGARRGVVFAGLAGTQLTLRLNRLIGWPGASAFIYALDTHGGAPSSLVGDVQGVSNLEAPPAVRLEEMWLQQNMLANHVSLLAGRYDVSSEFYVVQSGNLFLNSSPGTGPEFALSGVEGPSRSFPFTAVGARLDSVKPSRNSVIRAAVMDGVPVDRPGGGIHLFAPGRWRADRE